MGICWAAGKSVIFHANGIIILPLKISIISSIDLFSNVQGEVMQFRKFSLATLFCVTLFVSGCASFRNNEIATVEKLPDVSSYKNKPSIFIEPHFFHGTPEAPIVEVVANKAMVQEAIGNSIGNSGLFSKHSFDEGDRAISDYRLQISIYNHGNNGLAAVAGFICGFTLGVIPAAATDNYTIDAKLINKSGAVVDTVRNKDSITTWIGLLFIPAMAATPKKAINGTLDNQMKAIIKDLIEKGRIKYSLIQTEMNYFAG